MKKTDLKKLTNKELNDLLRRNGLNPVIENDEDREIAINLLSQLSKI